MARIATIVPARYILALLNAIGMAIIYGLKVNLSVAIVAMVNHTAVANLGEHHDDHEEKAAACSEPSGNGTASEGFGDGPFTWDEPTQGLVLGSYFWGYLVSQFPGGRLSEMFSGKHLFGIGGLLNIFATLLSPVAAKASYIAFILMRVIEGIGGGITFPATHVMLSKWAPPVERPKLSSIIYAGTALGTVISLPLSGILASELGWEAVFYVQGGLSVGWYILWLIFVYDSPDQHPFISKEEKDYINSSIGNKPNKERPPVPWRKILTSKSFWAILIAHTCSNWGWYMLLVELPTFMKYILNFDIKENALLSAVPYLCMWLFGMAFGSVASVLLRKNLVSVTVVRKVATAIASIPPAICLIAVTYTGCDRTTAVILLTVGVTCIAGMYSGFLTNHIDIGPNFAGTLMALTNTVATIPGFTVPVFVGAMTHGNQTVEQWRIIFFITAALWVVEVVVYTIFGSGEEQPWNKPEGGDVEDKAGETVQLKKVDSPRH